MRVVVEFDDQARTRARVTVLPSWLGRLFGRRPRTARIYYRDLGGPHLSDWLFEVDGDRLPTDLAKIVGHERRWQTRDVPTARTISRPGSR